MNLSFNKSFDNRFLFDNVPFNNMSIPFNNMSVPFDNVPFNNKYECSY